MEEGLALLTPNKARSAPGVSLLSVPRTLRIFSRNLCEYSSIDNSIYIQKHNNYNDIIMVIMIAYAIRQISCAKIRRDIDFTFVNSKANLRT
jgi:hypothetical protein